MPARNGIVNREERAVSPVIGVILMVAITVILAAVIGAFVLEIGDQQETAPNTSFDSEERVVFGDSRKLGQDPANLTVVDITHAGGDTVPISQANIKVEGDPVVIGYDDDDPGDPQKDLVRLQPDIGQTAGTNEQTVLSSGENWNVLAHGPGTPSAAWEELESTTYPAAIHYNTVNKNDGRPCVNVELSSDLDATQANIPILSEEQCGDRARPRVLFTGDSVNVVWTASSGGKTQTLFKYTVQSHPGGF
jgi:flagellin-like protein